MYPHLGVPLHPKQILSKFCPNFDKLSGSKSFIQIDIINKIIIINNYILLIRLILFIDKCMFFFAMGIQEHPLILRLYSIAIIVVHFGVMLKELQPRFLKLS